MDYLRIQSLGIKFDRQILANVSYTFQSGQLYLIQGDSGIGKSSLLNALGLLHHPDEGQVIFNQLDLWSLTDQQQADFRLQNFGFIFQNHNLVNGLTLRQNLAVPLLKSDTADTQRQEQIAQSLSALDLAERADTPAAQLSGGEDQRGAIGRALITDAKVIFADEPSNSLDHDKAAAIYAELAALAHRANKIVIVVSHEDLPQEYADVILNITDKQLLQVRGKEAHSPAIETSSTNPSPTPEKPLSIISGKKARMYNHMNGRSKKQIPMAILLIVTMLLCISGIILTMPQVLAQQQEAALTKATDNSIFVTNDTLHSNSSQDLDAFRNLSKKQYTNIRNLHGVASVYPYYTFVSYGLTKSNARTPEPNSTNLTIGRKVHAIDKTFSIEPLYPEVIKKHYLFSRVNAHELSSGIVVAQSFLDNNHISSKNILGKTISLKTYIPYAQYLSTSELPDDNNKQVKTDGNIYASYTLHAKIAGVLASNYPYLRSELGNGLFMNYSTMNQLLKKTIKANPLRSKIFANFQQQAFGYSALVVQAQTFNDTVSLNKELKGISPSIHVSSTAQDIDSLNKSIQSSQQSATNLAILIIITTVITLMITFFLTSKTRLHEIGILKAIGFSTQDIRKILVVNGLRYSDIMFLVAEVIDVITLLVLQHYFLLYPGQFLLSTTIANLILAFGTVYIAGLLPIRKLSTADPITIIEEN